MNFISVIYKIVDMQMRLFKYATALGSVSVACNKSCNIIGKKTESTAILSVKANLCFLLVHIEPNRKGVISVICISSQFLSVPIEHPVLLKHCKSRLILGIKKFDKESVSALKGEKEIESRSSLSYGHKTS